ncbi:ketopantoate reductase family protein [Neptunicella marina]|uniref:2-dehydropantoate 2-reductase n=1 Tax=Neptunicella marina TaxID=2125989 RepID=A0A8J6LX27_9ALTE|nr:2-dehydropantoate 2-reductase [Neptunicella marina]MBC3764540.1 2-dehydropantoate 2-reductase [Neptunicella marina]
MDKVVIVEQGAIGSVIAARCQQQAQAFKIFTRHQSARQLSYQHLASGETIKLNPDKTDNLSDAQLLIVPLKTFYMTELFQRIRLPAGLPIVVIHNGMGITEAITPLLPNNPLIAGVTNYGSYRKDNGDVVETATGQIELGWLANEDETIQQQVSDLFSNILPPCIWRQDISQAQWHKLSVNAVINPLTAIHQVKNGALNQSQFLPVISEICQEVANVMLGNGIMQKPLQLFERIMQVVSDTAENYSSMNRDIAFKRQTEIDFINGYIIQQAATLGIQVPANQALFAQIKQLESQF